MNIVSVFELTKIYETGLRKGGITALDGISLGVESGEIFGLLGPNGAGKTTLLKVLLGITRLTAGSVSIFGLPPENPESRRRVGYLPENHRFPDHLTGLGLLELTARLHRLDSPDTGKKAEDLLRLVGLDRWANTKIRKYSKGMLQRVGLAQALVPDPDLLFLDEPTDGVDPVGKTEIKAVLKKVRDEGKSIILNSHLLSEVEAVADRVAILSRGKILRTGSVTELTSRQSQYEIEAEFGDKLLEIPEEFGKRISLSTGRMLLELKEDKFINDIIDMLRVRQISIRSVKPIKITLEQSFMETVGEKKPDETGAAQI